MIFYFVFASVQVIDVGYGGGVIAMRLTHAGEDGFVLYIPSEVLESK